MKEKLKQETPNSYVILPEGAMRVPARIFTNELLLSHIEENAVQQVVNVSELPGIVGASLAMPDAHVGYGFCVGGVSAFDAQKGIISPGGIGFDINCGVRLLRTSLEKEDVIDRIEILLEMLGERVPAGIGKSNHKLTPEELEAVLQEGSVWAEKNGYASKTDLERTEENGCFTEANPSAVSERAKKRGMTQLGTLGGGNHFLEVQVVNEIFDEPAAETFGLREGQVVIMIHCGSRGLGHQTATDYLRRIEQEYPEIMESLPEKNLAYAPIKSTLAQEYYGAMCAAANFAFCNRQLIAHHIQKTFERIFPGCTVEQVYDIAHNIAKREKHVVDEKEVDVYVHRKGATRAFPAGRKEICEEYRSIGQPVLIPGSMGTASYVLVGTDKAMEETFGSSAHGAGRLLSRTQAKKDFTGEQITQSLKQKNIHVHAMSMKGVAEEAPGAYKDVDEVIKVTKEAGIANPVAKLKPLGVLKG